MDPAWDTGFQKALTRPWRKLELPHQSTQAFAYNGLWKGAVLRCKFHCWGVFFLKPPFL